ncbi:MAG: RNA-binding protein [Acidimicrobiia bacterium]
MTAADETNGNRIEGGAARAVLEHVARAIVGEPDALVVRVEERRGAVTLFLHAAPDDLGRLIGRRGRVAQALRTVVRAAGTRDGVVAAVEIEE